MTRSAEQARERALGLASETMAEIISFWGFKSSLGRVWTLLYLSPEPLCAEEITARTGLSTGAVSMALTDLQTWGIAERAPTPHDRKRHYRAETDVWAIVRRVIRERELRLVGRAVERFGEAVALLEGVVDDNAPAETALMLERLRGLLLLARTGYGLVERFAEVGRFSLDPIRGVLGWLGHRPEVEGA